MTGRPNPTGSLRLRNRRVTLASRPVGFPDESDFRVDEDDVGEPGAGEVLVRTLWLSVDPYQRGRMSEARSYARSLELGDVITAQAVGEVVESNDPRYGLTAYFGLFEIGQPRPGDTVVVSAAAGAVGQLVGQLAKLAGCRTVGIAGGDEKKRELTEQFGYDVAIDYKHDDLRAALKEGCPDGVDVYFDNVGGEISAAVYSRLGIGARIAICGQVSQYNLERPEPTFHPGLLIVFRARMQGFLVSDYASRFGEALPRLARWLANGELRYTEDVTEGLEHAPDAFMRMLRGENRGKALVKLR